MVRKVGLDVDRCILPGLLYDPDAMARAIDDTMVRSESDSPAHDPAIAPEQLDNFGKCLFARVSRGQPEGVEHPRNHAVEPGGDDQLDPILRREPPG